MSDERSNERDLEREDRRLQRLRLVVSHQQEQERSEEPVADFDPGPKEAA